MKKFDKRVKIGTMVFLKGLGWQIVKSIHPTRKWIEVCGRVGNFQRADVLKFTNK